MVYHSLIYRSHSLCHLTPLFFKYTCSGRLTSLFSLHYNPLHPHTIDKQSMSKTTPARLIGHKTTTTNPTLSRYESQKRRDWHTFGQYLNNHKPPLILSRCSGAHILEFLRYLDQFGKTKVHLATCPFFGHPCPPVPCPCPMKQAWGSLDALVGRLRAAFEENGGVPEANPFGARAVRLYLREVRDSQAKARGIAYVKTKKKRRKVESVEGNRDLSMSVGSSGSGGRC